MEGDLHDCVNLKGTLGDVPIYDNTSSLDATSYIRSWAVPPGLPPQDDGVGGTSLCSSPPAFVAFLHLPILYFIFIPM